MALVRRLERVPMDVLARTDLYHSGTYRVTLRHPTQKTCYYTAIYFETEQEAREVRTSLGGKHYVWRVGI
jgi:hypothetical protein